MAQEKCESQIGETISNWFEEFEKASESSGTEGKPRNIVFLINSSLPTLSNYITSAIMILNSGRRLPARALLRVSGELISRVLWVLKGKDDARRQRRLQRWIKTSYHDANRFDKKFVNLYKDNKSTEVRQKVRKYNKIITARDEVIATFTKNGIKYLPDTQTICEQVYKTVSISVGMFALNHNAIHPDLLVLTDSISENGAVITFTGDTDQSINRLRLECLTQACVYFEGLCEYYGSGFNEMADKYREQYKELCAGYYT